MVGVHLGRLVGEDDMSSPGMVAWSRFPRCCVPKLQEASLSLQMHVRFGTSCHRRTLPARTWPTNIHNCAGLWQTLVRSAGLPSWRNSECHRMQHDAAADGPDTARRGTRVPGCDKLVMPHSMQHGGWPLHAPGVPWSLVQLLRDPPRQSPDVQRRSNAVLVLRGSPCCLHVRTQADLVCCAFLSSIGIM